MPTNHTPQLPEFPAIPGRRGRPKLSEQERLKRELEQLQQKGLPEIERTFSPWVDTDLLEPTEGGAGSRRRRYPLPVVFWVFLYQVLCQLGCRGAVKVLQGWLVLRGQDAPSSNPAAYCMARNRLPLSVMQKVSETVVARVGAGAAATDNWCGHRVKVVDGTMLTMPDTDGNQAVWPQSANMASGCGFPNLRMSGLFCLETGVWEHYVEGNKHTSEQALYLQLWPYLEAGDVVLGDSLYGAYCFLAGLKARGVDSVCRLSKTRKINWERVARAEVEEHVEIFSKPRVRPDYWPEEEWNKIPNTLTVRVLRVKVEEEGFRSEEIRLVTTLLEAERYSSRELLNLYRRRWEVEVYFRDLKITLGMEELASKSPEMIRKEVCMYQICYNLLRAFMLRACKEAGIDISRVSFKGVVEQLSHWLWLFITLDADPAERQRLRNEFYNALTTAPLPLRPDRSEPRVRKRRPKNYRKMTRPRHAKPTAQGGVKRPFGSLS